MSPVIGLPEVSFKITVTVAVVVPSAGTAELILKLEWAKSGGVLAKTKEQEIRDKTEKIRRDKNNFFRKECISIFYTKKDDLAYYLIYNKATQ